MGSPPCWLQVSASRDTLVKTWRVGQQAPLQVLQAHSLSITGLSALPEHGCICTGARDYAVKLWDIQTGQLLAEDTIQQNVVTYICRFAEEHSVLQVWLAVIGAAWRPAGLCSTTVEWQPCLPPMQTTAVAGQSWFATGCVLNMDSSGQACPAGMCQDAGDTALPARRAGQ